MLLESELLSNICKWFKFHVDSCVISNLEKAKHDEFKKLYLEKKVLEDDKSKKEKEIEPLEKSITELEDKYKEALQSENEQNALKEEILCNLQAALEVNSSSISEIESYFKLTPFTEKLDEIISVDCLLSCSFGEC